MTSHDVVARIRRISCQRSVGHAGTLDPLASGVLVVLLGRATVLSNYAMASEKRYAAEIVFGLATDTDDAEGRAIEEAPVPELSESQMSERLQALTGEVMQVPPRYSAVKREGKVAYVQARAGKDFDLEARSVQIRSLSVLSYRPPRLRISVTTGAGAYIRSLARDAGRHLGSVAYLHTLVRVASGGCRIEDGIRLEDLTPETLGPSLLPADSVVQHLPAVFLSRAETDRVRHGGPVSIRSDESDGAVMRLYDDDGGFVALARRRENLWQPFRVLTPAQ